MKFGKNWDRYLVKGILLGTIIVELVMMFAAIGKIYDSSTTFPSVEEHNLECDYFSLVQKYEELHERMGVTEADHSNCISKPNE